MTNSEKLWGGRFTEMPDEEFTRFNNSFSFDVRLLDADIRGCIAHAKALRNAGILDDEELKSLSRELASIALRAKSEPDFLKLDCEDVHSFIEARLVESIGDLGKKLHAGRSRNDQVTTAFRIWMKSEIADLQHDLTSTRSALVNSAEQFFETILPGYTHLQRAQPILWPHWCLAYFEMLSRDFERLGDVRKRVDILPLGSAALAGTSLNIDRELVAKNLGFERVSRNSLDAVSDRDFAVEFVNACSLIMVHLSRFAEDLILYASTEFGFVSLSDAVSTGSSLMPQKKNPDSLELIRGKSGRVFGHLSGLLSMLKGLPLAYNKDMQEDKEAVFDSADTTRSCLRIAAIVLSNLTLNESKMNSAAQTGFLNATELADYLVRKGVPFRTAHDQAGRLVLMAIDKKTELNQLSLDELKSVSERIDSDVFDSINLENTLSTKSAIGGTSPTRVREELERAKTILNEQN